MNGRQAAWRRVVALCVASGIACPSFSASLGYFGEMRGGAVARARGGRVRARPAATARLPAQTLTAPRAASPRAFADQYRRVRLPANLTQAQRDFFGAHGYERTDRPGSHHTEWAK